MIKDIVYCEIVCWDIKYNVFGKINLDLLSPPRLFLPIEHQKGLNFAHGIYYCKKEQLIQRTKEDPKLLTLTELDSWF